MAGFAEGLTADPRLGQRLGEYRIKELLGRGGMGVVYLAEHERLGRNVALKLLAPALVQNEVVRERFVRESRRAAAIDHPNIIPLFEAGEADGHLFIAMRYVAGVNLGELLIAEGGRLDPERAIRVAGQVGAALDAAHAVGLVHRDVKPANVMVDKQAGSEGEHCYLTDFGLTKDISSSTGFTDTGAFVGTIQYVAPEQVEGRPLDARTDIYALGCVLYELFTGQVPFPRETDVAVMFAHVSEPPPRPSATRPELPAGLDAVIAKAMAKSPDERYRTCGELVAAARGALAGQAPAAAPTAPAAPPPTAPAAPPPTAPAAPPPTAPAVPQPTAAPPSHGWTNPEPAYPPAGPPPSWPAQPAQPPAGDGGPNYMLAAAIVAIAVLLTTAGVVGAIVLSKKGNGGGGPGKPSADESAQARRLIEQTADLNRQIIRLEERIAGGRSSEKKLAARLERERQEAQRLQAQSRSQLAKLNRVQRSLIASNRLVARATDQLDQYLQTKSNDVLDGATFTITQGVDELNNASSAYEDETGSTASSLPDSMHVDPADLPEVKLQVPDDANVKLTAGVEGGVDTVTGVGDVNGDGRGDVLATYSAEGLGGAYVVFGQRRATDIDLTQLGSKGFELSGGDQATLYGAAGAGDVDGDGKDDLVVPDPSTEQGGDRHWLVVFGSDSPDTVDLTSPGERIATLTLSGQAGSYFSESVAQPSARGVGDVNGDGNDDIGVASPSETNGSGGAWIVTKVAPRDEVRLDDLGGSGFRVTGLPRDDAFGGSLAGAGDVNGDKIGDIVIGAPYQREDHGAAYVVFGSREPSDVDASDLGGRGIVLKGGQGTTAAASLAGPGDVNGDGLADIVVGAPTASPDGRSGAGVAYVVFGRRGAGKVDLTELGTGGFRIDGPSPKTNEQGEFTPGLANEVAGAGDVNGDGTPDIAVDAFKLQGEPALAYIVYGKASPEHVDLRKPGGQAVSLEGPSGAFLRFGDGTDFDGDRVSELPFSLAGESTGASDGYLIKVKR